MNFKQHTTDISGNLMYKPMKLSGKDSTDVNKVTKMMLDTVKQGRRLWRKEINHWQQARQSRYSIEFPQNWLLQEVYKDIMLDAQLTGITQNRTFRTTNKEFIFVNKEGKKDDTCTEYIKEKKWFENIIQYIHETTYFGTGLIWMKDAGKGEIKQVECLDRAHVIPEKGLFVPDITSQSGLFYKDAPHFLIEVQMYDAIGLLEKAAPYTILKRHSWGSWDEFEELFGIPIRIAKVASTSESVKQEVSSWLEEMGSSSYGVFPVGTEIEIKENSKGDAFQVFYSKLKALREELSMLMLHQTMTTENGGSKAQGTVHENTLGELVFADEKNILSILNDEVVPAMRFFGYKIPEGYKVAVAQTKDPKEQIKIDQVFLTAGYVIPKSYIEEVYGTEIEAVPTAGAQKVNPATNENPEDEKKE